MVGKAKSDGIRYVDVQGLLDEYNYRVDFKRDSRVVIIYGPNGVGKTRLLRLIDHVLSGAWGEAGSIPFRCLDIVTWAGATLHLERQYLVDREPQLSGRVKLGARRREVPFTVDMSRHGFELFLITETSWEPMSSGLWRDSRDGEVQPINALRSRYGRARARRSLHHEATEVDIPAELESFQKAHRVKYISTQRLRTRAKPRPRSHYEDYPAEFYEEPVRADVDAITEYSNQLTSSIKDAMEESARLGQLLESTLARRLLDETIAATMTEEELRKLYDKQAYFALKWAEISGVAITNVELPARELLSHEIKLLEIILGDADQKIQQLAPLAQKIQLLVDLINRRLHQKTLSVSADRGLQASKPDGTQVSPSDLSSGEQHEIIMFYDLLFGVESGALVLVDEPELSLHVTWQLKYISDVLQIADKVGFQLMVATHSPQIVANWTDYSLDLFEQH